MKTRIDDYEYIYVESKNGGFGITIEPATDCAEQEIFLEHGAAKKLVDYIKATWENIDDELLAVICGEVK